MPPLLSASLARNECGSHHCYAMERKLRVAGIAIEEPQRYPNGYFARLYDPEGNPIELWQPCIPT